MSLQSQLDDAHDSLATALARIEEFRLRYRRLELENVQLRNLLRRHGVSPAEEESSVALDSPDRAGAVDNDTDAAAASGHDHGNVSNEHTGTFAREPVVLHANGVQVPGSVTIRQESFEFSAVAATITPTQFVGVRFFAEDDNARGSPALACSSGSKASWWENLFGPAPTSRSPDRRDTRSSGGGGVASSFWQARPKIPRRGSASSIEEQNLDGYVAVPHPTTVKTIVEETSHFTTSLAAGLQDSLKRVMDLGSTPKAARAAQEGLADADAVFQTVPKAKGVSPAPMVPLAVPGVPLSRGSCSGAAPSAPDHESLHASGGADQERDRMWQVVWKDDSGTLRTLTFRTSAHTRGLIQAMVERWNELNSLTATETQGPAGVPGLGPETGRERDKPAADDLDGYQLAKPHHLVPSADYTPAGARDSGVVSHIMASALAAALPGRKKLSDWRLLYSTDRDGFLLHSMYRAGRNSAGTLLIVEAFNGYVFGAYCTDPWRINPRYQGKGECFVFQLRPHMVKYAWRSVPAGEPRNDFFQLISHDSLGIGGGPTFAMWLDSDLLWGNSGHCRTFGCPVIAGSERFKVKALELWQVGS